MNNSCGVRYVEPLRDVDGNREQIFNIEWTAGDAMLQRLPVEELHRDKRFSIHLSNVVNGADVGVVQRRCGLGLALKAGQRLRIAAQFLGEKLQSHEPVQAGV